jgi:hypothetical protein
MKPERWKQVGHLYHAALESEPESRAAFLDEACAGDEELRRLPILMEAKREDEKR